MVEARKRQTAMMALLLSTALLVVACGASGSSPTAAPGAGTSGQVVKSLTDVAQLQDRFNADKGSVRLVLLLSPT